MPRTERREAGRSGPRWSAWWVAVPVLGLAAYAAFSATLSLLGEDPSRAPVGAERDDTPVRSPLPAAPVAVPAALNGEGTGAVPAAAPAAAPAVVAVDAEPSAAPPDAPSVTATPATRRAAADKVRKVKPKAVPREHLTEQDHRALDAIIEQAGKSVR